MAADISTIVGLAIALFIAIVGFFKSLPPEN